MDALGGSCDDGLHGQTPSGIPCPSLTALCLSSGQSQVQEKHSPFCQQVMLNLCKSELAPKIQTKPACNIKQGSEKLFCCSAPLLYKHVAVCSLIALLFMVLALILVFVFYSDW